MSNARPLSRLGNGPIFSAYQSSAQSLTSTAAKINFQTEDYDPANAYDTSTSRFNPQVPGYYKIDGVVSVSSSACQVIVHCYKNGSLWKTGFNTQTNAGAGNVSTTVYLNGSTDYVEIYAAFSTTQNTNATTGYTWFQGSLIKGA